MRLGRLGRGCSEVTPYPPAGGHLLARKCPIPCADKAAVFSTDGLAPFATHSRRRSLDQPRGSSQHIWQTSQSPRVVRGAASKNGASEVSPSRVRGTDTGGKATDFINDATSPPEVARPRHEIG